MGSILVHIDLDGRRPHPASLAALTTARALASSWGATLYAALIIQASSEHEASDATTEAVPSLARHGADKVVVAVTDAPVLPLWGAIGGAWQTVIDHLRPRLVVFGADAPAAIELGPRSATRIGARLLVRTRVSGGDLLELRDREGAFLRVGDGGAAVAMVGGCASARDGRDEDVDVVVLAAPSGADRRLELSGTAPADPTHVLGAVVALGDDAAGDPAVVAATSRLAALVGAPVLRASGGRADKHANTSAELFVAVGTTPVEPSGASTVIKIGGAAGRHIDGALAEPVAPTLAELVRVLESRS